MGSPELAAFRDEPRFQALIGRLDGRIRAAAGTMVPKVPPFVLEQASSRG